MVKQSRTFSAVSALSVSTGRSYGPVFGMDRAFTPDGNPRVVQTHYGERLPIDDTCKHVGLST